VPKPAKPKVKECYENAREARQRALQASTAAERDEFLAIEKSWLKIASSYLSKRLDRSLGEDFPKHPKCPSCAVAMWLVEMNSSDTGVECRYQCKACDRTIVLNVAPEKERTSSSTLPGQTPPAEEVTE
jgi:hypothetical protein